MHYSAGESGKVIKELSEKYPDLQMNNNKSIGSNEYTFITKQKYIRQSMKRSNIRNVVYDECVFENVAFNDTSFQTTEFRNSILTGNSFACCKFVSCSLFSNFESIYISNNYSQSNFTNCSFTSFKFRNSSFLQSAFFNCEFKNVSIESSTLEGSSFNYCEFFDVDLGKVNIEFIEFMNCTIQNVILPFYQIPYIIGIANHIKKNDSKILVQAGEKIIESSEYISIIDNLLIFFDDKLEHFATCNLNIMKNDLIEAQNSLLKGINDALTNLDFRMIRFFCRLAKRHDLLNEKIIKKVLDRIDSYLISGNIPAERLNDCIIHSGEIRQVLLSGKSGSINLNLSIKTNITKDNFNGISYINNLSNTLNKTLSNIKIGQNGFQVAIANHSPYEIVVDVICTMGALATIIQTIWTIIADINPKVPPVDAEVDLLKRKNIELSRKYIDTRIELMKEQIINLNEINANCITNKHIVEVTQKLKTDLQELYDDNIMITKNRKKYDD